MGGALKNSSIKKKESVEQTEPVKKLELKFKVIATASTTKAD